MKRLAIWLSIIVAVITVTTLSVSSTDNSSAVPPRPTVLPQPSTPTFDPITIVSMGDSLTEGINPLTKGTTYASYRGDLTVLLNKTGQPHTWVLQASGGKKCSYFAGIMAQVLQTYNPRIVFLDCGTNDTPTDNTEADYRTILSSVASYNSTGHNVLLVASLIGVPYMKSPENSVRPYIIDWMLNTNLAIQRALASYPQVPVANMWKVPANPEWLYQDGIHLIARSEAAYAQLFYQAAQPSMGWLTLAQMRTTAMCGLNGIFRTTDPWPIPDVDYPVCRSVN